MVSFNRMTHSVTSTRLSRGPEPARHAANASKVFSYRFWESEFLFSLESPN